MKYVLVRWADRDEGQVDLILKSDGACVFGYWDGDFDVNDDG